MDSSIRFNDLITLLKHLKFDLRIRGSHHIFTRTGLEEILNFQPKDTMCKSYQVKQVRDIIIKYHIGVEADDE
jgi:predicted RNA binding protein YcfA (HicA-like mRNA interferase family)